MAKQYKAPIADVGTDEQKEIPVVGTVSADVKPEVKLTDEYIKVKRAGFEKLIYAVVQNKAQNYKGVGGVNKLMEILDLNTPEDCLKAFQEMQKSFLAR
jgi:hypothetical protein